MLHMRRRGSSLIIVEAVREGNQNEFNTGVARRGSNGYDIELQ
jgi:hypothetical protein